MSTAVFEIADLPATCRFGRRLGARLSSGQVIALIGPLGSGKTTLVKSLAAGAGVPDPRVVTSPTFVIVNEYDAGGRDPLHIYHIDVYRLRGSGDLEALGFEEMCGGAAVIIEWADRVADLLPADRLNISIEPLTEQGRRFHCTAAGPQSIHLLESMTVRP